MNNANFGNLIGASVRYKSNIGTIIAMAWSDGGIIHTYVNYGDWVHRCQLSELTILNIKGE